MSYSIIFLDMIQNQEYYLNRIATIGEPPYNVISSNSDFQNIRRCINFGFKHNNGIIIVYNKKLWHKLQKVMLIDFERPSLFKEEAYIIASGFKKYHDFIFADIVYDKPIVFVSEDLDNSFDFNNLNTLFKIDKITVGVFESDIDANQLLYKNEVYSLINIAKSDLPKLKPYASKIFTISGETCALAFYNLIKDKPIKISIIDLASGGILFSQIAMFESLRDKISLCIDNISTYALDYLFGIDKNLIQKNGYFSEAFAKELGNAALLTSGANFSISIIPNDDFNKFLFFLQYNNTKIDIALREFAGLYNTIRQKVASFGLLYLRNFILESKA